MPIVARVPEAPVAAAPVPAAAVPVPAAAVPVPAAAAPPAPTAVSYTHLTLPTNVAV